MAFREAGITLKWEGSGLAEKGVNAENGEVLIEVDPQYFRPAEVETLLGNPSKAKKLLGWNPRKTSFAELVKIIQARFGLCREKAFVRQSIEQNNEADRKFLLLLIVVQNFSRFIKTFHHQKATSPNKFCKLYAARTS